MSDYCKTCQKEYKSPYYLKAHYNTEVHKKQVEINEFLDNLKYNKKSYSKLPIKNKNGEIISYTKVDNKHAVNIIQHTLSLGKKNHVRISVDGKGMELHRYIYYVLEKNIPKENTVSDHINSNPTDNRLINLRETSFSLNSRNKKKIKNSSSKYYGVSKHRNQWECGITYNNIGYSYYYEKEEHAAYHHDLLVKKFGLEKYSKLNNIEEPKDFVINSKPDLPKNIIIKNNEYYYTHRKKPYGGYKTIEEAVENRDKEIEKYKIFIDKEVRKKPIERNTEGVAIIEITNKKKEKFVILVDDEDYYYLKQYPVCVSDGQAKITIDGKMETLSHVVMKCTNTVNIKIDHLSDNILDDRKSNLKIRLGNSISQSKKKKEGCTSKYIGVCFIKETNKWKASIKFQGKTKRIGIFLDEVEAALARDKYAKELNLLGNNYKLNF